jgi:hypothetical protein
MNSPGVVFKKWRYRYDIGHNNKTLSIHWHVVYATKGVIVNTGLQIVVRSGQAEINELHKIKATAFLVQ